MQRLPMTLRGPRDVTGQVLSAITESPSKRQAQQHGEG